jgi:alkylhydroperoxidase family enzyme
MLCVLEKVTLTPAEVTPDDMLPLFASGISPQAIEDALVVGALFNIIDRMADSLDVAIPTREEFTETGERLLQHGYI